MLSKKVSFLRYYIPNTLYRVRLLEFSHSSHMFHCALQLITRIAQYVDQSFCLSTWCERRVFVNFIIPSSLAPFFCLFFIFCYIFRFLWYDYKFKDKNYISLEKKPTFIVIIVFYIFTCLYHNQLVYEERNFYFNLLFMTKLGVKKLWDKKGKREREIKLRDLNCWVYMLFFIASN